MRKKFLHNSSRSQSENYIVPPRELGVGIHNLSRKPKRELYSTTAKAVGIYKNHRNYNTLRFLVAVFGTVLFFFSEAKIARALDCSVGGVTYPGVMTGLGCIPVEPEGLVFWGLRFIIGIAGGLALLLLLFGGIKYITSKGDPKALQSASSTMTSALGGFLLIILSVLILRVIGYEIFRLPGWGVDGGKLTLPGA